MYPAVPPPKNLVGRSVDFKLKPGWRYNEEKRVFVDDKGVEFAPPRVPKKARVAYKVPSLRRSAQKGLSNAERDLQRYMQVILSSTRSTTETLKAVQSWPWVEEAHLTPNISLPLERSPTRKAKLK